MAFAPVFQRPFRATFDRRAAAAAAGNGLLNALIAYWKLDEAGGANDALDAHSGGLTLAQVGSPGASTGLVYATARQTYVATQTDCHFNRTDNALRPGDTDFTFAAWINLTTTDTSTRGVLGTWQPNPDAEYILFKTNTNRISFGVSSTGNPLSFAASVTSVAAISTAQWNLVVCQHDAANNQISLQINNGAAVTAAHSGGVAANAGTFRLARHWSDDGVEITRVWRGLIGPVAFWKSAAGGGGVLTAAQRTALYNAGAGLAYAQFTT